MMVDVARMLGVDRRSVRRCKAAYHERGAKGIEARPTPGRLPKLDQRQRTRQERLLLKGARPLGYESDLWTCPRVAELIAEQFGVSYHPDHIGRLLRSADLHPGLGPRRPAPHQEKASRKRAPLAFHDESGLMMAPLVRRTWNPRGETPSLRHCGGKRRKVSAIGALCVAPDRSDVRLCFRLHPNANVNSERVVGAVDAGGRGLGIEDLQREVHAQADLGVLRDR